MEVDDLQDVSFKLTDENGKVSHLKCHKFTLAMDSPVFKSQFFGPLKAKDDKNIEIIDGSSEIFSDLINFVYREEHFEKFSSVESTDVLKDILQLFYFGGKYQNVSFTPVEPKPDVNKMDTDWMMSVSAQKQRNQTEFCLQKQVMIHNTTTEMKNTRDGNSPAWNYCLLSFFFLLYFHQNI